MRIQSSAVQLSAQHLLVENHERQEQLQFWIGQRPETAPSVPAPPADEDPVKLSGLRPAATPAAPAAQDEISGDDPAHPQMTILRLLLERMTGRRITVFKPAVSQAANLPTPKAATAQGQSGATPIQNQGWGMIYDYHESTYQAESTSFQASGTFRTADGKQIDFSLKMDMSREYSQETNINLRAGDALKDPLVINFTGAQIALTQDKFAFDLNADGQNEQIGMVKSGSGFLILDKNHDGAVNDGSELFGPTSGNGYQELAAYDSDKNGWIDEADPVFQQLRVWSGETADSSRLESLAAKGIGAISLARVATPFTLTDDNHELQGQVRETGIYAREDGSIGTVQQVDLVA